MIPLVSVALAALVLHAAPAAAGPVPPGNPDRGASVFRQCTACHTTEPDRHLTGPSLAGVFGRKAGAAPGFGRYSDALRASGIVWNDRTLDAWLENPQQTVPGNYMTFPGIRDDDQRADLIAYLERASQGEPLAPTPRRGGGMIGGGERPNLKTVAEDRVVTAIRYCGDGYRITLADGRTLVFWEFNLRFKTDSSPDGPARGKPVLLPAGMMGDRASMVFAGPEEISRTIERRC